MLSKKSKSKAKEHSIIHKKINKILEKKSISKRELSRLVEYNWGNFNQVINGRRPFPADLFERFLSVFEISKMELESWILADNYSKEVIELAIKNKKGFPYKRKSLLTAKIDAILSEKDMSRRALAVQMKYSQSGLNRMIIGKIGMSNTVLERISKVLKIPRDEVLSWIVVDNYSLELLEAALEELIKENCP